MAAAAALYAHEIACPKLDGTLTRGVGPDSAVVGSDAVSVSVVSAVDFKRIDADNLGAARNAHALRSSEHMSMEKMPVFIETRSSLAIRSASV